MNIFVSVTLLEKLGLGMTLCSAVGIKRMFVPLIETCLFRTLSIVLHHDVIS